DLERRHPDAADLEHVVSTATVGVDSVRAPKVFIAGTGPLADKGATRLFALVPVARRRRFTVYQKLADFIVGDVLPFFADQSELVAMHRHPRRAILHGVRKIGQKQVPHFGRADAVYDVDPESFPPGYSDMRRQWFTGRKTQSQPARCIFRRALG